MVNLRKVTSNAKSPSSPPTFKWSTKHVCYVVLLCLPFFATVRNVMTRQMSVGLQDGDCVWTQPEPLTAESDPYGTLLTSYPASGMRVAWQQIEGLTGILVGDDYGYSGDLAGIIKTQYPHYEGIWSYGSSLDQVILLIRNPRWAIPSFHKIISQMNYAKDWEGVYSFVDSLFSEPAPNADWVKWRDLTFDDEINLWAWFIDFWMEDGAQYWDTLDYERIGQTPFHFPAEGPTPLPKDNHCVEDINCFPKALIVSEKLEHYSTGPNELRKIADVLRGKKGMTVLGDEYIDCIWFKTFLHHMEPNSVDMDTDGVSDSGMYDFTNSQMETILSKLTSTKAKYAEGKWLNNIVAQDLVLALDDYIVEVSKELTTMQQNPAPTPAPNSDYDQYLNEWYESIGLGGRYAYEKVHTMSGYWPLVAHLYNETDESELIIENRLADFSNYEDLIEHPPTRAPDKIDQPSVSSGNVFLPSLLTLMLSISLTVLFLII